MTNFILQWSLHFLNQYCWALHECVQITKKFGSSKHIYSLTLLTKSSNRTVISTVWVTESFVNQWPDNGRTTVLAKYVLPP